jgi:hypothetical protein
MYTLSIRSEEGSVPLADDRQPVIAERNKSVAESHRIEVIDAPANRAA